MKNSTSFRIECEGLKLGQSLNLGIFPLVGISGRVEAPNRIGQPKTKNSVGAEEPRRFSNVSAVSSGMSFAYWQSRTGKSSALLQ